MVDNDEQELKRVLLGAAAKHAACLGYAKCQFAASFGVDAKSMLEECENACAALLLEKKLQWADQTETRLRQQNAIVRQNAAKVEAAAKFWKERAKRANKRLNGYHRFQNEIMQKGAKEIGQAMKDALTRAITKADPQ